MLCMHLAHPSMLCSRRWSFNHSGRFWWAVENNFWSAINLPLRLQMVQVAFWRHYEEKWSLAELGRRTNITAPLLLSHHSKLKIYCVVFSCVTLFLVYTYVHFLLPLHNAAYSFNSPNFFHFDKLFFRNSKALSLFVFCWLVISLSSKNWIKCKEYLSSRDFNRKYEKSSSSAWH